MKYATIPSAQSVVQHCKAKGIENIVISPGSRNAPLTIGFSEDSFFKCFSIVDERCAGFFALGIAQQIQKPVALVCTSGSALLNYYPAIAEAFYSQIPLVVISADRPIYKIDIGDGQTIRQDYVFERHIGYSANLKQDVTHATDRISHYAPQWLEKNSVDLIQEEVQQFNDGELNLAMNTATGQKIPVHINVPFEEPLYNVIEKPTVHPEFQYNDEPELSPSNLQGFLEVWNASERKMVLVGANTPNCIQQEFLDALAEDSSVVVLTETTSNLHHESFFPSIDSIIAPIEKSAQRGTIFEKLRPEIVLTFGGLIVSKKIKAFLREYRPEHHWHVDSQKAFDTFFSLSQHFKRDVNSFFMTFLTSTKPIRSEYYEQWNLYRSNYINSREAYLEEIPFSDMKVFDIILSTIPKNYQLQLANSSTVRYAQLFDLNPSLKVFCNRGTSGIDGSTSTAIGGAMYHKEPTILITGDLSFFYDSNGLWNKYIRPDFRIILINNQGGGIFRILPGTEDTENFETYFETTHNLNAQDLCKMYGIGYQAADDQESLENSCKTFYTHSNIPQLLEISTPRLLNDKILLGYFDFISSKLS
ncbi:2-succinyl-5-enolpyruvyl-6-hydroxy-3-cyclohexene-1-carboxylic-acid synthase [Maribacter halichondriae]|uniref:2-succinyl-5-enolpyruvyl-6-hydroxy-3- cyclohexene-1-carboxylic-acid synthase n=1 Tax=Maribacter halichondriae TaxID=2980554 RepID=UPI0023599D22|nr:2-succinyl-5-enolpyruvyl-6-hydroxy-3-cyclohexene-1-carboxylic-acid synthase [Maribacter sp. Hal144]